MNDIEPVKIMVTIGNTRDTELIFIGTLLGIFSNPEFRELDIERKHRALTYVMDRVKSDLEKAE